MKLTMTFGREE